MAISNMKADLSCSIQKVWDVVTSLENFQWRSDLSKIEVLSEKQFIEFTKDGYATTFTITAMEPCKRWEFDMENSNLKGHWMGLFLETESGTRIDFTEKVEPKKFFLKPFVRTFLKKQQEQYIVDLRMALKQVIVRK